MTDIHSHILFNIDDGIRKYEDAVTSLRWLKQNGINFMYLTPHIMSEFPNNTSKYLSKAFNSFIKRLENDGIDNIPELKIGAEYMLEPTFERHKDEGLITFADHHVLVETSYMTPPMGFIQMLEKLMEDGYSPILAHPERYNYMDNDDYKLLKKTGVKFQLNFLSLTGSYGRIAKEKAAQLLKDNQYSYTGSDFHDLSRHNNSFFVKSLTKKQIENLRLVIENNNSLW